MSMFDVKSNDPAFIRRRAKAIFRSKKGAALDAYMNMNVQKYHFAIPLKPQDKPVDFPAEFHKTLKTEYAVRYLEQIGAAPTAENLRMVEKEMPIDKCRVTAAWKSRGWLADYLYVTPKWATKGGSAASQADTAGHSQAGQGGQDGPAMGGGHAAGQAKHPAGTSDFLGCHALKKYIKSHTRFP